MSDQFPIVRVAVVQAGSVIFDREKSITKACQLVREAGEQGAELILLPEAFIPAYPRGLSFGAVIGSRSSEGRKLWGRYWANSVEIPSPSIDALGSAAKDAGAVVAVGIVERDTEYSRGTLFCSTIYFDSDGKLLGKHRKLKPTGSEL